MTVTVVTGASSGIGRSLARRLAAGGDSVAVLARRKPLLDSLVEEIVQAGGRALAVECNVTDRDQVQEAMRQVERTLGPIDRLVANAGGGERTLVDDFQAAQIERVVALNLGGAANCIEAVLPGMLRRGSGHLVATSSIAGYRGLPHGAAYGAAKAALSNMMESLRLDLEPRGVAVTTIHAGFVKVKQRKRPRPFAVDVESATRRMHRAILDRRRHYAFPLTLTVAGFAARLMPAFLYDRLMRDRGAKPHKRAPTTTTTVPGPQQ